MVVMNIESLRRRDANLGFVRFGLECQILVVT